MLELIGNVPQGIVSRCRIGCPVSRCAYLGYLAQNIGVIKGEPQHILMVDESGEIKVFALAKGYKEKPLAILPGKGRTMVTNLL